MTRKYQNTWRIVAMVIALAALTRNGDASVFGLTPVNEALWHRIGETLIRAVSPVDVMLLAILAHARRRRVL